MPVEMTGLAVRSAPYADTECVFVGFNYALAFTATRTPRFAMGTQ
jgi:hypothetical protein